MRRYLYINEPFEKPNVSPMQFKVTFNSDTKLSRKTHEIDLYGHMMSSGEHKVNKYDRYDDDFYATDEDDDRDYYRDDE